MPRPTRISLSLAAVACACALAGCGTLLPSISTQPSEIRKLESVEVTSYQGKRLDSIGTLRENSIKGPQHVDLKTYRLDVSGTGLPHPVKLRYARIIDLPNFEKAVRLDCVEGWSADLLWQGVKITDIVALAASQTAPANDSSGSPRSRPSTTPVTVIFHCADGYTTSLPYSFVRDNDILLAYKENGVSLPERFGFPFQVVAENKWGYKWAKWVTAIELSADPNYKGYWEQRGYPNDGSIGK